MSSTDNYNYNKIPINERKQCRNNQNGNINMIQISKNVKIVNNDFNIAIPKTNKKNKRLRSQELLYKDLKTPTETEISIAKSFIIVHPLSVDEGKAPFSNLNSKNINEEATLNLKSDLKTTNLSSFLYTTITTPIGKCHEDQQQKKQKSMLSLSTYSVSNVLQNVATVIPSLCCYKKDKNSCKHQALTSLHARRNQPDALNSFGNSPLRQYNSWIYKMTNEKLSYVPAVPRITSSHLGCFLIKEATFLMQKRLLHLLLILLSLSTQLAYSNALLVEPTFVGLSDSLIMSDNDNIVVYNSSSSTRSSSSSHLKSGLTVGGGGTDLSKLSGAGTSQLSVNGYLDKLDNLERSVAAVLIKVAYGTTSTTKRSIPDNSHVPSLTTIPTPLLTTLRYLEKSPHQQQINLHHRNYELDLERDHALPTSAPNADILKSNSNPTYPNPNRHHNHDRERHRHLLNSTPLPSLPNILKKTSGQSPTIPMYPGDIPSYSPPARSFFTPPLPPEYQNPFADKPTLRGTNNEAIIANTGTYINRRPIPPPSLMPGHERIPFRPPDLAASTGGGSVLPPNVPQSDGNSVFSNPIIASAAGGYITDAERKKALNTPSRVGSSNASAGLLPSNNDNKRYYDINNNSGGNAKQSLTTSENQQQQSSSPQSQEHNTRKEVLPSIRRILSGANGYKGEVPEVLLKQVTTRPLYYHQPPSSPVVLIDDKGSPQQHQQVEVSENSSSIASSSNINKSKNSGEKTEHSGEDILSSPVSGVEFKTYPAKTKMSTKSTEHLNAVAVGISSTPSAVATVGVTEAAAATYATSTTSSSSDNNSNFKQRPTLSPSSASSSSSSSSTATIASSGAGAEAAHATWSIAWNIHVYLSVVLFTILAVYSFYKMLTYNKLTHLFSQSYFVCIHLILIIICAARIFYLCYDAYNIHASFHIFISELLLNLPATFLTISFSVLILYLFLKSLNHKNNRYSALIRPLTVVVGCGVHVVLCITLHYVESYTMQNHQQHLYYHQQQQQQQQQLQLYRRQQQHLQQQAAMAMSSSAALAHQQYASSANLLAPLRSVGLHQSTIAGIAVAAAAASVTTSPPPRVLSLICQIIYIFICLSLGLLYLYLYRILKRILRSKSQNYIHGYQNLSYAIHITIATALLFVLLAVLQIFGAISISTTRTLIIQSTTGATTNIEIDWLQWGYQFSLRLIEISIITLITWVAGLKTSGGNGVAVSTHIGNGDSRLSAGGHHSAGGGGIFGSGVGSSREKHLGGHHHHHHHNHHSNVAGFFLPCTSSSSQEQFDTDYPAVCNANTNLHTYTMRTGKLIYDDSFALNSLATSSSGGGVVRTAEIQLQQQQHAYQRPYDTALQHNNTTHTNAGDYGTHSGGGRRYHQHDIHQYADYLTDATTDHYENPNFDLRGPSSSSVANSSLQKFATAKTTSTTSTTASSSGGGGGSCASTASQQQMLLLPSDSCYSEPMQQNCTNVTAAASMSNYDFNNFERPKFGGLCGGQQQQSTLECWSDVEPTLQQPMLVTREKNHGTTLERAAYENPERRSSNSTNSCVSNGGSRYVGYNSFERVNYNGVRKSGTLSNIVGNGLGGGGCNGRNASTSSAASSNVSMAAAQRASGVQTLAVSERHHQLHQQSSQRGDGARCLLGSDHGVITGRSSLERSSSHLLQQQQQQQLQQQQKKLPREQNHNSDDDMVLSGSNVERTNLINNEDGSCITGISGGSSSNSTATSAGNLTDQGICSGNSNSERLFNTNLASESLQPNNSSGSNSNNSGSSNSHSLMQRNPMPNHQHHHQLHYNNSNLNNHITNNSSGLESASAASSQSSTSPSSHTGAGKMLVAELGFVRFRALDDINNAQGVGIHNASIRAQNRGAGSAGAVIVNSKVTASASVAAATSTSA